MGTETLDEVFRDEWGRLLALLVAQFRRLDLAEDGLSEAFLSAAARWPGDGVPGNPAAWLLTAARRKIIDRLRAEATAARKEQLLVVDAELARQAQRVLVDPGTVLADERLRLIFLCAHPVLTPEAAAALTLRLVLGVPTADIAAVFQISPSAMAARLTRAKRTLSRSGERFAVPVGAELPPRLSRGTGGRAPAAGRSAGLPAAQPPAGRPTRCPARRSWRAGSVAAGVPTGTDPVRQRGGGRAPADQDQAAD